MEKLKEFKNKDEKKYAAQEIINMIMKGWTTEAELGELYQFIENAQMENEDELEKLRESGYVELIYHAYEL